MIIKNLICNDKDMANKQESVYYLKETGYKDRIMRAL